MSSIRVELYFSVALYGEIEIFKQCRRFKK